MRDGSSSGSIAVGDVIREGGKIAAIFAFWGVIALIGFAGIPEIGYHSPGSVLWWVGNTIGWIAIGTGIASILIYVIARGVQYSRE